MSVVLVFPSSLITYLSSRRNKDDPDIDTTGITLSYSIISIVEIHRYGDVIEKRQEQHN